MSYNTIIEQGSFISAGPTSPKVIPCRIDPDWVEVYNSSQFAGTTALAGIKFYWQKGMAIGSADAIYHPAGDTNINCYLMTTGGIYVVNTALGPIGNNIIDTGTSNSTTPTVTTSVTTGLFPATATTMGAIVRFTDATGALPVNLGGFDYEVNTVTTGVSFVMRWAASTAFNVSTGATGRYIVVPFDPIFYPRARTILNIQGAATTLTTNTVRVTTSVSHGYTVGQQIRLNIPAICGAIELNGVVGTVTNIASMGAFDLDVVDNTLATPFTFPTVTQVPCTFPQAVPVGENTAAALAAGVNVLGDAEENQAAINIVLGVGTAGTILGPCGAVANDVIYWKAGRSFSNN